MPRLRPPHSWIARSARNHSTAVSDTRLKIAAMAAAAASYPSAMPTVGTS